MGVAELFTPARGASHAFCPPCIVRMRADVADCDARNAHAELQREIARQRGALL